MNDYKLMKGDCLERLREIPDNSVDAIVTDPPYGLGKEPDALKMLTDWIETGHHDVKGRGFMGKEWDAFVPQPQVWHECLRVLKPGGHLLAFAGTRTQDLMTLGLRLAGFEIRDMVAWVYGSGFPKSLDVSKALDKMAGVERETGPVDPARAGRLVNQRGDYETDAGWSAGNRSVTVDPPATDAAKQWDGWGTALKPALEPITLARKPLEGTVASNVLKWHTGALNIDGCRVGLAAGEDVEKLNARSGGKRGFDKDGYVGGSGDKPLPAGCDLSKGRWPANLIHDGSDEVVSQFPDSKGQQGDVKGTEESRTGGDGTNCYGEYGRIAAPKRGDSGSAARFFFQAKHEKEGLLLYDAKTTINPWQDLNPVLSNVDIAENPSSLRGALESIAQKVAATWPNLAGILSSDSTNPSTSVTASEFETLCATVTTAMTSIGSGFSQESQQEKRTPCNSLVKCVATQEQTGITTITASLLRSDGFAESATLAITLPNMGLGEAASRFRYCAKTAKSERGEGNNHPTVKPLALMRYLCRLITPPGGTILDPYLGSGSTGLAALGEGFDFIGIERDDNYFSIAEDRIRKAWEAKHCSDL